MNINTKFSGIVLAWSIIVNVNGKCSCKKNEGSEINNRTDSQGIPTGKTINVSVTKNGEVNKTIISIDKDATVADLKLKIFKANNSFSIKKQKLILNAVILEDNSELTQCNIKDGTEIILEMDETSADIMTPDILINIETQTSKKKFQLNAKLYETIAELKERIAKKIGPTVKELMFNASYLVNNFFTLSDYKITAGSKITVFETVEQILNINVMMEDKNTYNVDVAANSIIDRFFTRFLQGFKKVKEDFKFVCNGKELEGNKTFALNNIQTGDKIFCIKREKK